MRKHSSLPGLTRQSITFGRTLAKRMDARVVKFTLGPAEGRTRVPAHGELRHRSLVIGRREFILALGGAATAAAWPLAARAQQPMPVIGFLRSTPAGPFGHLVAALRRGLNEAGFVEGQNVAIEFRWADDHPDRLPALAADLIGRPVDVIAGDNIAVIAAKAATTTVPLVFVTAGDPVRSGLVASLNRPGGNATGIAFLGGVLGAKRLELLRQLVPKATTIAMLVVPDTPTTEAERRDVQTAARTIGQELVTHDVRNDHDIEAAFATFVQRGAGALFVGSGAFLNSHTDRVVALAGRHRMPAVFTWREAVVAGALMSYGTSVTDAYRQAGVYAGRILKGEKPADLPVMQAVKFEFVLNLKTARTLGLDVPDRLLALADEVIE
jgi:putative tryptophan/tyrosine transport system substrate-binding protein